MATSALQLSMGALAIISALTTAVLLFITAGSTSQTEHRTYFVLLLVSASVEFLLSVCLTILLIKHSARTTPLFEREQTINWSQKTTKVLLIGVIPSLIATLVVAATVALFTTSHSNDISDESIPASFTVSFAVWVASIIAQAAYFATLGVSIKLKTHTPPRQFLDNDHPQEIQEAGRPNTGTSNQSQPFYETTASSLPSMTMSASDAESSLRSSYSTIQKPRSHKRGLLGLSHSPRHHSAQSSFDGTLKPPSQDEGFDSWDVSGVSTQMRETVLQKRIGLPTIPGSRSPSPAKALDGPFFTPSPDESPPISPLPQPSISRPNSPPSPGSPKFTDFTTVFPAAFASSFSETPPTTPQQSQKSRFSQAPSLLKTRTSEDHIHPLFRTCSPTPPPSASSNTTVTAAPEAGEVINRQTLYRMRSCSQPSFSSTLSRSESFPDIREKRTPLSPVSGNVASAGTSPRSRACHQRKRSVSFEGCIGGG